MVYVHPVVVREIAEPASSSTDDRMMGEGVTCAVALRIYQYRRSLVQRLRHDVMRCYLSTMDGNPLFFAPYVCAAA